MTALVEMLLESWAGIPSKEAAVFLISMLPVLELRGGLLAASYLGIDMIRAVLICVAGCFLPVPFILLMIRKVIRVMKKCRLTGRLAEKLERHGLEKSSQVRNRELDESCERTGLRRLAGYDFWGLFIFVAIPLPGTGAWTGALVAALLGIRFGRAMLAIFLGVLVSAGMMTGLAYGILDFFW